MNGETRALVVLAGDIGFYYLVRDWAAEAVADYTQRAVDFPDEPETDAGRAASVGAYIVEEFLLFAGDEASEGWEEVARVRDELEGKWSRVDVEKVGAWALEMLEGSNR